MFNLHPQLQADTHFIQDLEVSSLLLMNDANYLWMILVPRQQNLIELTDLKFDDQIKVLHEINLIGKIIKDQFAFDKLNIGALGNVVSQLHIHLIGRKKDDVTFPKPVWGNHPIKPYQKEEAEALINKIKSLLQNV